ncbi:hypothetical protein [Nocardia bovistercoris]|uniref:Uncharacterized protein n=1 Tax=Nocardia bovistercoris TaxID=2785916 RepID=A0A931N2E8_9NOCA|nr:hypothetical protein [Nocardia bovistercoris]MBH0776839.1 hypothetical protein [Nocardia bovistercoris]
MPLRFDLLPEYSLLYLLLAALAGPVTTLFLLCSEHGSAAPARHGSVGRTLGIDRATDAH